MKSKLLLKFVLSISILAVLEACGDDIDSEMDGYEQNSSMKTKMSDSSLIKTDTLQTFDLMKSASAREVADTLNQPEDLNGITQEPTSPRRLEPGTDPITEPGTGETIDPTKPDRPK